MSLNSHQSWTPLCQCPQYWALGCCLHQCHRACWPIPRWQAYWKRCTPVTWMLFSNLRNLPAALLQPLHLLPWKEWKVYSKGPGSLAEQKSCGATLNIEFWVVNISVFLPMNQTLPMYLPSWYFTLSK